MNLADILSDLSAHRGDEVVIATMTAGFAWPLYSHSARDFCYIAPMGSASSIGLGLALARPDLRVWVLDGDGSLLMNLGALVTIGAQSPRNLVHIVLNNGVYAITGGQRVPGSGVADLAAMARAAGVSTTFTLENTADWKEFLVNGLSGQGPVFVDVRVAPAYDRPAVPAMTHTARALMTQGGPGFHNLRALLRPQTP